MPVWCLGRLNAVKRISKIIRRVKARRTLHSVKGERSVRPSLFALLDGILSFFAKCVIFAKDIKALVLVPHPIKDGAVEGRTSGPADDVHGLVGGA
jgi:hypothetical protein